MPETECRKCEECEGFQHHWMLYGAGAVCKHCGAQGRACEVCGGEGVDWSKSDENCDGCDSEGFVAVSEPEATDGGILDRVD